MLRRGGDRPRVASALARFSSEAPLQAEGRGSDPGASGPLPAAEVAQRQVSEGLCFSQAEAFLGEGGYGDTVVIVTSNVAAGMCPRSSGAGSMVHDGGS